MQVRYDGAERRRALRVPICLPVAAECDAWAALCHTRDLSRTGLFLISEQLPAPATGFSLELVLPGQPGRLRLRARVVRVQGAGPRGFGVHLDDPPAEVGARLDRLTERWIAAFGAGGAEQA